MSQGVRHVESILDPLPAPATVSDSATLADMEDVRRRLWSLWRQAFLLEADIRSTRANIGRMREDLLERLHRSAG